MINDPKMINKLLEDFNSIPKETMKKIIQEVLQEDKKVERKKAMSEADKMFEELGYEIDSTIKEHLYYNKNRTRIDFNFKKKKLCKYFLSGGYLCLCPIDMKELEAIVMKCNELGW